MELSHAQTAYVALLRITDVHSRMQAQLAMIALRDEIAQQEHRESESVQNQYERIARSQP